MNTLNALPTNALPSSLRLRAREQRLWLPREVARLFGVDSKTVTRWNRSGKIEAIRTIGGHRRFAEAEVRRLFETGGGQWPA